MRPTLANAGMPAGGGDRRGVPRSGGRPSKNWKFSPSDVREREYWDDYQRAYSDMLSHTSTKWAPWYVLPADHKWFTRLCAAAIIANELIALDPRYPAPDPAVRQEMLQAKARLEAEASGI